MRRIARGARFGGRSVRGLVCAAALLFASPAFAQSDWFRPPADIGSSRAAPQGRTQPRQAPSRQRAPEQRQQWRPLFPLFDIFRGGQAPPRYADPQRDRGAAPATGRATRQRRAPVQVARPTEPRGTVYPSIEAARKDNAVKITDVVLVIGDEYTAPLAQGLADAFASDREGIVVIDKGEGASGFGPDSTFNWVTAAAELARSQEATAIVAFAGGNDLHPVADGAGKAALFDERWREIYGRRLDELLVALKAHGRPVVVVGLPPVDDDKQSNRNSEFNDLLKEHVERAGLIFVDVWDGFVDENGKFRLSGPAVDGQRRRLRTSDGVGFTRAGGRKLAFFVDRSLGKLLNGGEVPATAPGGVPTSGNSVPMFIQLTGDGAGGVAKTLAGAQAPEKSARVPDTTASRVLVSGEPLTPVNGRVDDFRWTPPGAASATKPQASTEAKPEAETPETPADQAPAAAGAETPPAP